MNKYTRSFCGAFFGAALAIWPAATWNMAELLLIGGVAGWLLGYHGDRLISSFVRGYKYARRIGFKLFFRRMLRASVVIRMTVKTWRGVGRFVRYISTGLCFVCLAPLPFKKWGEVLLMILVAIGNGIAAAPGAFADWYAQHPINRASTLRFFAGLVGVATMFVFFWWLMETSQQPGDIVNRSFGKEVLTANSIFLDHFIGAALLTGILTLATTFTFIREFGTKKGYYAVWNRYERSGSLLFFVGEFVRFEYFAIWLTVTVAGGFIIGTIAALIWMLLALPAYFGVIYALRLSWRAVRLNRDYGVISLAVALLTGAITFFSLREELVVDPVFRLSASLAAGFIAGISSMGITWFCGVLFSKSITARRIALKKKYTFEASEPFDLIENVAATVWKYWKLLVPSRVREGCAAFG